MNVVTDIGENVTIWETEPASSGTIPDDAFAPICERGIELNNDYEPVVYQSNRVLMAANAAQELNELQERNHATTAYSTLDCVATPLFPTFNAQRKKLCAEREEQLAARSAVADAKQAQLEHTYMLQRQQVEAAAAPVPSDAVYALPVYTSLYNDQPYLMNNGGCATSPASSMESIDINGGDGDGGRPVNARAALVVRDGDESDRPLLWQPSSAPRANNGGYILLWVALALLMVILICVVVNTATKS